MLKTRVAVLRGGPSSEYDVSLETGSAVLRSLPDEYQGIDVFIDKNGVFHRSGLSVSLYHALKDVDVVFNALHGAYGEDGKIEQELDRLGIPYTGPSSLSAALSMNKLLSKERFKKIGLHVPNSVTLSVDYDLDEKLFDVFKQTELPVVVKPVAQGSSLGVTLARSLDDIERGVRKAFGYGTTVLVEEYIPGKEATVGVVENFRDEDLYALAPIEVKPTESPFFDYDAKYKGRALLLSPGNFNESDKRALVEMAKAAHQALGLRHYSSSDFILSPGKGIFILETDSLPGLTPKSLVPQALKTATVSMGEFLKHILSLALEKS
jgi:D-alanine-D-alanine ligase